MKITCVFLHIVSLIILLFLFNYSLSFLFSFVSSFVKDEWTEGLHAPLSELGVYVNLLQNPEQFTGYSGPSARRVWKAIKEENCFGTDGLEEETCFEKRIFYRLMSGE
jgi:hypothetical protein